ncbi:MAG: hypothetical protein IKO06_02815, partial [Alphaproteobacteria bacterium]|nr:hypothetical protein [Alphaproteobacteria bacterium]
MTFSAPKVGIFWLIPIGEKQTLVCFTQDIEKASHTDMYYDSTFEHIKCWPKVLHKYPELKNAPYEKYPRGRITFISKDGGKSGTFKLMADKKILAQSFYVQKLKEIYNIDSRYKLDILL